MARMPDVACSRFFSGVPIDALKFKPFYTIALLGKYGSKLPPQSLHVRRAAVFPTENRYRPPKKEVFMSAEPFSPQFIQCNGMA